MKPRTGFTLIELLVGIAITLLIGGSLIMLFGVHAKAVKTGLTQQEAYEEARLVMNELKTTLRYADKTSVTFNAEGTKMTYQGKYFDKHWDADKGGNVTYTMELDFSTGKQLYLTKKEKSLAKETTTKTVFPKYEANSAFGEEQQGAAVTAWSEWVAAGNKFPIKEELAPVSSRSGTSAARGGSFAVTPAQAEAPETTAIYTIFLPIKYVDADKQVKVEVLQTRVLPTDYANDGDPEGLLYKQYTLLTEGAAIWGGSNAGWDRLNSAQKNELQNFYAYFYNRLKEKGNVAGMSSPTINTHDFFAYLGNNDRIREYLASKYTGNIYPVVVFDNGSNAGLSLYLQPTGKEDASESRIMIPTASVFIFARSDGGVSNGWYTNQIYNHETQTWYTGPGFSVRNLGWPEAWSKMQSLGWHPIALKNN